MSIFGIIWVIVSYLLGSIPFGYLISRFSGKNILEVGWRKTSGSNVFRNVGVWQGILTGVLDLAKGFLAVWGAQKLGFAPEIQVFSGLAAVTGHNWSCFLKFAGGRGIATLFGAFFVLSLKILGISFLPLVILAILWDAAIGTLLFFPTAIFLSIYFGEFETIGIFSILAFLIILVKRLGPIKEIKTSLNPRKLIINRLLFDDDVADFDFRIKKIFSSKKITKPLNATLSLSAKSAKLGFQVAKIGIETAKNFIVSPPIPEKIITEIGINDFKNMMIASAQKIVLHQEEINKINVFPVADKDTGYNLAATLLGAEGVISQKNYETLRSLIKDIKEAMMANARGNVGMIYTGYLIKVLDKIDHLNLVAGEDLARAMKIGIKSAYSSIEGPVEGTILDTIKVAGERANEVAKKEKNIIRILEEAYKEAQIALKETKEKLEVLKKNDVVDAGALGFVKILEAWVEALKGLTPTLEPTTPSIKFEESFKVPLKYRYCFQVSFNGNKENLESLKEKFSSFGNSMEILESQDMVKIHIHTNRPEVLKGKLKNFSGIKWEIEDMSKPMKKVEQKPLGLVVDESANLPKEFLEKYEIEEVFFKLGTLNGEVLTRENLYSKIKKTVDAGQSLPPTSQPSFADFLSAYQKSLEKFEQILVITPSCKLSGTYSSARIARSMSEDKKRVFVFDTFSGEVGEGLAAVRAQELISQGKNLEEILAELKELCPKIKLFICPEDLKYAFKSTALRGRFHVPEALVKLILFLQKINIRLLLTFKNGKIKLGGIRFGKNISEILAKEILKLRGDNEIRVAISHSDNLKGAEELKTEIERQPKTKVLYISESSVLVGSQLGPGTLIVAFYEV